VEDRIKRRGFQSFALRQRTATSATHVALLTDNDPTVTFSAGDGRGARSFSCGFPDHINSINLKSISVEPFVSFAILQAMFSTLLHSLALEQPLASNGKCMVF